MKCFSMIAMSLSLSIFIINQTITYSEATAVMTAEQKAAKSAEINELIKQLEINKSRKDYNSVISQIRFADYWNGKDIVLAKFEGVDADLKAQLLIYLTEACLQTNQYQSVQDVMKSAKYCTGQYIVGAGAFQNVRHDHKVALINNLTYALIKSGKSNAALSLLTSNGAKYLNQASGKYTLIPPTLSGVNKDIKAEFIDTIISVLINTGHKTDVLDIIHQALYFNKVTLAVCAGFSGISADNRAALCTNIAKSFNDPQKVLDLMKSAEYWNGLTVFYKKTFDAIEEESVKRELVSQFEIALRNSKKPNLISALKKAAGID